jgi:hypothetical protein
VRLCEDCKDPIVWLKRPDGSWLPPVEPILDFAYADHFIVSAVDGIAQPMPQVYRLHQCLTPEERQIKRYEREKEKRDLIEADRLRRQEAARVLEETRRAAEAAAERERKVAARAAKKAAKAAEKAEERRRAARRVRFEKEVEENRGLFARHHLHPRLLESSCEDCGAEAGECCRTKEYGSVYGDQADRWTSYGWWNRQSACNYRYRVALPDDRSRLQMTPRWGEDYDEGTGAGTTPDTVGSWPPARPGTTPDTVGSWPPARPNPKHHSPLGSPYFSDLSGHYDMAVWLRDNYLYVFEPEKVWLQPEEEAMLTGWLAIYGDLFEEVTDGPGDVDEGRGIAGAEGDGGGHAERTREREAEGDRLDPGGRADAAARDGEHADRPEQEED